MQEGNMEIKQLLSFVTIAHYKSFTKAAEQLGYTQSAITIQIRLLEEELNVKLFDRIGKKVSLTANGNEFIKYAINILNEVNQSKLSMASSELEHMVHIGTIESLCSARLMSVFQKVHDLHPKMKVKVTTDTPENLIRMMETGDLDLVYVLERPFYRGRWEKVFEQREEIVFVCNAQMDIAQKENLTFDDILEYPFILTEKNANYRFAFDHFLSIKKMNIHPFLEISDTHFIQRMLLNNECISLLPYFTVEKSVQEGKP